MGQNTDKDLELVDMEDLELGNTSASAPVEGPQGLDLDLDMSLSLDENFNSSQLEDNTSDGLSLDGVEGLEDLSLGDDETQVHSPNLPSPPMVEADELNLDFGGESLAESSSTQNIEQKPESEGFEFEVPDNINISFDDNLEEPKTKQVTSHKSKTTSGSDQSDQYSHEIERLGATIHHLRQDREELQKNIQKLEDEKIIQSRQFLNMRAELDEKKVENAILRKRAQTDHEELKTKVMILEEKKALLEERQKQLLQEIDKLKQREKMDVRHSTQKERDLEQKLELLKADSETQLRNRDLKIMELKRRIDGMEYDMETISLQEKQSIDSKVELEDKLEKAIKTLRGAISILENDEGKSSLVDKLKKNLDV